jgi:rod shape determining protein RodA
MFILLSVNKSMAVVTRFLHFFRGYDWIITLVIFILTALGLAAIYSVDLSRGDSLIYFPKQVIAFVLGFVVFFVARNIHKTRYESVARLVYIFGLFLLVSVLFFGVNVRGTTGWFRFFGFSFQPAEFAKLALVLLFGWWMNKQGRRYYSLEFLFSSGIAVGLYVGLILLQPDLGSALVLVGIWFGLLLFSGTKKRYIALLVGSVIAAFVLGWFFLFQTYQKERLLTFVDPGRDPLNTGYNVTQSIIAIGSGKVFGRGLGFGSQSQLHFLPEAQTDFISSVIGEELGFIGLFILLILYFVLLWRFIRIAVNSRDDFSSYTVMGIALLFFIQLMVNMGGATGLLPVTGVTLPFVSYGGSSLIINYALVGIAESIARGNKSMSY